MMEQERKLSHSSCPASRAGGLVLKKNVRRWCVAKGFNIIYYNTKEKNGIVEKDLNTVKGHFDLRNVIKAEAVSDGVDDDAAIKVSILEPNRPADQPPLHTQGSRQAHKAPSIAAPDH